ncbi:MAG TPA: flagellar basal body P-ring protein FlgI [Tepidisphaeraceae bacterium]|nr:flagellar basal body P-ring protein FlgI [Tepidisphaeraceae bacterium]
MHHCATPRRHFGSPRLPITLACCALGFGLALAPGCSRKVQYKAPVSRYDTLPEKEVAPFLQGTIHERTMLGNIQPYLVSGYGLVANLDNTGGSEAPIAVREYMIKQMQQHKFGSALQPGFKDVSPSRVLADRRFAIVRVDGYMPPGIREGDYFDVNVSALPESSTTSLARGDLYRTDLREPRGVTSSNPSGSINVWARTQGPVFVNPGFAIDKDRDKAIARRSLRHGIIMDGGHALTSRPLVLRLLQPQRSMARRIEWRIDEYFQDPSVAAAQDEGVVYLYVPAKYRGDWEHFAGVVTHLFLRDSEGYNATKAKELAAEAVKPGAPLAQISYCWEALGHFGLPFYKDLMGHADPAVAYYATRAAAFVGDPVAPQALSRIAHTRGQFQLQAIRTLGALPNSPAINQMLRPLLDSEQTLVRIEAYKVLAAHKDPAIFTNVIAPMGRPEEEKFVLDIVKSQGPPVIHATRTGIPRIAIIGDRAQLNLPVTFAALDGRLTISSSTENPSLVTIFYRPAGAPSPDAPVRAPSKVLSRPDLAEIIARLGGEGAGGLNFNYGDVVSILSALTDNKKLSAYAAGQRVPASFVLQDLPSVQDHILGAPAIPDARPQADEPGTVGMAK